MNTTTHAWVIIKIQEPGEPVLYKLLSGWRGGYLDGDSWKLNSGIVKIEKHEDHFLVHGYSSSIYKCYYEHEGMTSLMGSIYNSYADQVKALGIGFDLIDYDQFLKEFESDNST